MELSNKNKQKKIDDLENNVNIENANNIYIII